MQPHESDSESMLSDADWEAELDSELELEESSLELRDEDELEDEETSPWLEVDCAACNSSVGLSSPPPSSIASRKSPKPLPFRFFFFLPPFWLSSAPS